MFLSEIRKIQTMFGPHRELYVSIFPKDTFPNGVAQIMKICEQSDLFYQLTADIFIFDLFVHKPQMSDLSDKTGLCVYTAHLQIRHFFFSHQKLLIISYFSMETYFVDTY